MIFLPGQNFLAHLKEFLAQHEGGSECDECQTQRDTSDDHVRSSALTAMGRV